MYTAASRNGSGRRCQPDGSEPTSRHEIRSAASRLLSSAIGRPPHPRTKQPLARAGNFGTVTCRCVGRVGRHDPGPVTFGQLRQQADWRTGGLP